MDITTKQLTAADTGLFTGLLQLFEEVFEMKGLIIPNEDYLKKLLQREDFIVFVAAYENVIVGGLTAHILPSYYSASSEIYIYDIAVKTNYQRQGIGEKLILALTEYCSKNGYQSFFVQADEKDAHALDFYHSTGGIAKNAVHFNYWVGE
jgi:aminoglycoside 3-N-acetyltransferase I